MKPNEIKAEILRAGYSQRRLAEELGCSESQLSQVINGHRINEPIRIKLARKLNRSVEKMFGKHFRQPAPAPRDMRRAA